MIIFNSYSLNWISHELIKCVVVSKGVYNILLCFSSHSISLMVYNDYVFMVNYIVDKSINTLLNTLLQVISSHQKLLLFLSTVAS